MKTQDGSYIFYADESGDHSLISVDPRYPVFALALCAFRKDTYCTRVVPRFQRLKFHYFGHDSIVLHEHDIRKQKNDFRIFVDQTLRERFLSDLNECVKKSPFRIFSTVIHKDELRTDFFAENPYSICLKICLQQAALFLKRHGEVDRRTHFIFEKRGSKEDNELELEFRRITSGENELHERFPNFIIHFSDKRTNSTGMQIADLTARPLGLRVFRPAQANRAYELIQRKIMGSRRFSQPSRGIYIPK
ncbi:DUF3800 domain-containing protein [Pseudohoeflea suaedae]|uniref:DUF3800 domain-containing protein n=1 Tax=Pseudohoeflea suaedae TaxID=877384 RepID=A0A4R5PLL0_9HYPH|nr:DUF3800 domain-containing protein [Pseudohoeflea suaedae]TDH37830.1 DUF3800 domain-containing protein [Pseudohoeflea suaedae]